MAAALAPQAYRRKISKLTYNEMLDFWGSLAECVVFLVNREIPQTTINQRPTFVFLKALLRADVRPDW